MDAQYHLPLFGMVLTGWKGLGLAGALCFASRWFVQVRHRRRTRSAEMPTSFWLISVIGAALTSAYFIWGKNDSVGILQNVLPLSVAVYNLWLDLAHRRRPPGEPSPSSPS